MYTRPRVNFLERLDGDVVTQELLLAEARRLGAQAFSTTPDEGVLIAEPTDSARALIRHVIDAIPAFDGAMRDLRVRYRMAKSPAPEDREQASLALIEHMADRGAEVREIVETLTAEGFSPKHSRVFDVARLRRLVDKRRATRRD